MVKMDEHSTDINICGNSTITFRNRKGIGYANNMGHIVWLDGNAVHTEGKQV